MKTGWTSHRTFQTAAALGLAGALAFGADGCHSRSGQAQTVDNTGVDPALANMAQPGDPSQGAQVLGQSQSYSGSNNGESYETQAPAPIIRNTRSAGAVENNTQTRTSNVQYYPVPQAGSSQASYGQQGYADPQNGYEDPNAYYGDEGQAEDAGEQAVVEADQPPPPLPEYEQPAAPEDNYIWTPGYWDYAQTGYYWVPGVWCAPPFVGALWTPPYWGYYGNSYRFHRGYWGPHVGYYGGINYGFGYIGFGYFGGYWRDRSFYYNRSVTNVNIVNIHNVYNRTVIYNGRTFGPRPFDRVSYNGGRGGINVQPRPQELAALREAHYAPLAYQRENRLSAASNRAQFFAANRGRPEQAFVGHPLGNVRNIPPTPQREAINTRFIGNNRPDLNRGPGQPNNGRPDFNNRPGQPNQPNNGPNDRRGFGGQPGQPNNGRPDFNNRPSQPNQPNNGINDRRGFGGQPNQPGQPNNGRPGLNGSPNQPGNGFGDRRGFNGQPGNNNGQPGNDRFNGREEENARRGQPGAFGNRPAGGLQPDSNGRPAFNRPGAPAQPGTAAQPHPGDNHPGGFGRPDGGNFNRPGGFDRPNGGNFNRGQAMQSPAPQQQPRQEFQRPAQPAPQQQSRPQFQNNRPAPQAAPAPRGGGDHNHH